MIRRLFFVNYDLAYGVMAVLFTIGAAAFLGYLILLVRL
jgi:hypothetical protein